MADYNLYPGMDAQYNFPPPVRSAIANYPELQAVLNKPPAGSGVDANDVKSGGLTYVPSWTNMPNRPPGATTGWILPSLITSTLWSQIWFDSEGWTANRFQSSNGSWRDWVPMSTSAGEDSAVANSVRMGTFLSTNPPVYTEGKAAVSFIFDHGLTNFKSKGIPALMSSRGFKYGLALNSGRLSDSENSGASVADVKSWAGAEIWNHGKTHSAQTTEAGVRAEIVDGKTELESLFGVSISGYVPAGVGATGLMGFDGGSSAEMWGNTLAGQLIMSNHALTTGYMGSGGYHILNGIPQQGQARFTMDTQTEARVKTQIDGAIAEAKGLVFLLHPSLIDGGNGMALSVLTNILNYLKTKVESGNLVVLSPSELVRASNGYSPVKGESARETKLDQLLYDTGQRKLANPEGLTGTIWYQRAGNHVMIIISSCYGLSPSYALPETLPVGLRPRSTSDVTLKNGSVVRVNYNGVISVDSVPNNTSWTNGILTYIPGSLAIPSSVPGTLF